MLKLDIQAFAVPFRKVSKTRKRMRRTHYKIEANGTVKCPKCGAVMSDNCYVEDAAKKISDLIIIEKDNNLKKTKYPIKAKICKTCGYVELYAELEKK